MYLHEFQGKNIYTKLGDVIELKRKENNNDISAPNKKSTLNVLSSNVLAGGKNKKEEEAQLKSKMIFITRLDKNSSKHIFSPGRKANPNTNSKLNVLGKNSVIVENSKQDQFLNLIKNAIGKNKKLIGDPDKYLSYIDKQITKLPNIVIEKDDFDFFEEEIPPHKLKQKLEENEMGKKISDMIKKNKENQNQNQDQENKFNHMNDANKSNMAKKETLVNKSINPAIMRKFEKTIINGLVNIYQNNISVKDVFEKRIIPHKAYSLPLSFDFFEAVKFENIPKVESILSKDRRYLLEYDYFHQTAYHWASKRGNNSMLSALLDYGCHVNILDNEFRTPLWLAAKYNLLWTCDILLQKQANPFLVNKEGKKPIDVTTDSSVKKLLTDYMDKYSYMKSLNYFKSKVLGSVKDEFVSGHTDIMGALENVYKSHHETK